LLLSKPTRDALAAAKARVVKLGIAGPSNLRGVQIQRKAVADAYANQTRRVLLGLKERGVSQRAMVDELNQLGVGAPRGRRWHLPTAQRVMDWLLPKSFEDLWRVAT
jgi:hypothetical protein